MRWTAEKVEELRGLAHLGSPALGKHFGCRPGTVRDIASKNRIHLGPHALPVSCDKRLRARWAEYLPGMKALQRELQAWWPVLRALHSEPTKGHSRAADDRRRACRRARLFGPPSTHPLRPQRPGRTSITGCSR
jgi:hypothetical protein